MKEKKGASKIAALWAGLTALLFLGLICTGLVPLVFLGGKLSGFVLLAHVGLGGAFALCLALLAVMRIETHGFDGSLANDGSGVAHKIAFWIVVFCGLCLILSAALPMLPLGTDQQRLALLVHRYSAFSALASGGLYACLALAARKRECAAGIEEMAAPQAS